LNNCNFIIFPIQITPDTYSRGWSKEVIDELHKGANGTLCILGERKFAGSSSPDPFNQDLVTEVNQTIFFPFFGVSDDQEIIDLLILTQEQKEISIIILIMTTQLVSLSVFQNKGNVSMLKQPDDPNIPKAIINRLKLLGTKDLIIISHDKYSTLDQDGVSLKSYIDYHLKCSFMTVRGVNETATIEHEENNVITSRERLLENVLI
jgi:hypothetical protein